MNNFWILVGFEYKKIFNSKINAILLAIILIFSVAVVLLNAYGGNYYHSIGTDISKIEALKLDKETMNSNKGFVTDEVIKETIILAQNGYNDKENYFYNAQGKEVLKPDAQREFILPYSNIYFFLNNLFDSKFDLSDGSRPIEHLSSNDINDFYKSYKQLLADNINYNNTLTLNEKNKHIDMIEKIKTPFYNEYAGGWLSIRNMFPLLGILILTSIAIAIGNIFGKEYSNKTDAVILSTKKGKSVLIAAKITTAITFAILSTVLISGCYIGTYLFTHGLDGGNVPLQLLGGFEYSTYPVTIGEFVGICCVVFLATAIAFSCFCAMVSAIFNNSVTALSLLMLSVFAPMFIPPVDDRLFAQIKDCLFSAILNHETIFSEYFYTFGDFSFMPFAFYMLLAMIEMLIFIPIAYNTFKRHQVG